MAVGDDPVRAANTQKFSLDEIDSAYKAKALDRGRGRRKNNGRAVAGPTLPGLGGLRLPSALGKANPAPLT